MARLVLAAFGLACLGLGAAGAFVPLLPTVPFMLLAAFCFARSSERLHAWLLAHRFFGPSISDWRERGAISGAAKRLSTVSMIAIFGLSCLLQWPMAILLIQAAVLGSVTALIWTRPNP